MDNLLPSDWASRVYYGGLALAVIWRFVQKRTLMKWPDAILLGLILIALAAGAISAAPWTLKHFGGRNLAVSQANDSTEVATLKEDNAKLKVENSRLKKTKAPREVTVLPAPPSESRTPISAKLSADDCDDLTRAQQLRDSAEENLIKGCPYPNRSSGGTLWSPHAIRCRGKRRKIPSRYEYSKHGWAEFTKSGRPVVR